MQRVIVRYCLHTGRRVAQVDGPLPSMADALQSIQAYPAPAGFVDRIELAIMELGQSELTLAIETTPLGGSSSPLGGCDPYNHMGAFYV